MIIKLFDHPVRNCDCGFNIIKIFLQRILDFFQNLRGQYRVLAKQKELMNIIKITKEPRPWPTFTLSFTRRIRKMTKLTPTELFDKYPIARVTIYKYMNSKDTDKPRLSFEIDDRGNRVD